MQKSEILSYVSISSSNVSRENWEDLEYLNFDIIPKILFLAGKVKLQRVRVSATSYQ